MKFDDLISQLGLSEGDQPVLRQALTHSSTGNADNERLEFLGDRVLGLAMAEMLFSRFPNEKEGDMAKRHAALVSGETLSKVAQSLNLGDILLLSQNERQSGGHQNDNILSDAMEAVLGAAFLSKGYEFCRKLIAKLWESYIDTASLPPQDPKTALQEWSQGLALGVPKYELVSRSGPDHDPRFTVSVNIEGHPAVKAEAKSKRAAEKEAAKLFLNTLPKDEYNLT